MPRFSFNASVGKASIRSGAEGPGSYNQYTRDVRSAMRGIIRNYDRLINHVEAITPEVLVEALEPTFEKSQEYCPKDTGTLVNSGYLEVTSFRGNPRVEIGYARGGNPPYAVAVHENLEWRHKSPTRAKWLQVALAEDATEIQQRIVAGYRRVGF